MSEFREDFSVIEENQLIPAEMEQDGETEEQDDIRLKSDDLDDVREDEELDITGEEDEERFNISELNEELNITGEEDEELFNISEVNEELDITGKEDSELFNISEVNDKKYNIPEQEERHYNIRDEEKDQEMDGHDQRGSNSFPPLCAGDGGFDSLQTWPWDQFFDSVMLLKGLLHNLNKKGTAEDEDTIDVTSIVEAKKHENMVRDTLIFIHNVFFSNQSELTRGILMWMKAGITAIVDMMNGHIHLPIMKHSKEACEEFLTVSFQSLAHSSPKVCFDFFRLTVDFRGNFSLGGVLTGLVVGELHRTAAVLIGNFYRFGRLELDRGNLLKFSVLHKYFKSLLSRFGVTVFEAVGIERDGRRDVSPTVGVEEIQRLSVCLDQWGQLLQNIVTDFSRINPAISEEMLNMTNAVNNFHERICGMI